MRSAVALFYFVAGLLRAHSVESRVGFFEVLRFMGKQDAARGRRVAWWVAKLGRTHNSRRPCFSNLVSLSVV